MASATFRDAMGDLSELLYARAMKHRGSNKRIHTPGKPGARADAQTQLAFEVKLERGGVAEVTVNKYCAGYVLNCSAWLETSHPTVRFAGHVSSSDGGGKVFGNLSPWQRLQFELRTSFWSATTFTLRLQSTPPLPEGTVLKVRMDIDS